MEYIRNDLKYGRYATYMLVDNKKEGPYKEYYINSQLDVIFNYINGEITDV